MQQQPPPTGSEPTRQHEGPLMRRPQPQAEGKIPLAEEAESSHLPRAPGYPASPPWLQEAPSWFQDTGRPHRLRTLRSAPRRSSRRQGIGLTCLSPRRGEATLGRSTPLPGSRPPPRGRESPLSGPRNGSRRHQPIHILPAPTVQRHRLLLRRLKNKRRMSSGWRS